MTMSWFHHNVILLKPWESLFSWRRPLNSRGSFLDVLPIYYGVLLGLRLVSLAFPLIVVDLRQSDDNLYAGLGLLGCHHISTGDWRVSGPLGHPLSLDGSGLSRQPL